MKQQSTKLIKWEKPNELTLKIELIIFTTTIDLKHFEPNFLKIDKNSNKNIDIYYIGHITIKKIDDYGSIYRINPLHLCINYASGYIEEKNGNKYLIFDSCNENKEALKKYADVWDGIKSKIKAINDGKENNYEKSYIKIKFNSDDELPLKKPLKFHLMTIIIRCYLVKMVSFTHNLF